MKLQLALRQQGTFNEKRSYLLVGVAELPLHWPGEHFYPFSVESDGDLLSSFSFRISKKVPPISIDAQRDRARGTPKPADEGAGPHHPSLTPSEWLAGPYWSTGDELTDVFLRQCRLLASESRTNTHLLFGSFHQPYQQLPLKEGMYTGTRIEGDRDVKLRFEPSLHTEKHLTPEALFAQPIWGFGETKHAFRTLSELSYLQKNQTAWELAHRARKGERIDRREYQTLKTIEEQLGEHAWHRMTTLPDEAQHFKASGADLSLPISESDLEARAKDRLSHLQKLKALVGEDPSP